ncbi:CmcJ/NvfI family oxidoreductase [Aurantiacibacter poecillastricola]|uniref:CmcJ/NvfI family oxidoreductase n=1 Tax=Aurantiacibacter poecillastricola TaxID=3064385 RepID=UPI00273D3717|nr:CmcJ/NvfI family oxidoreductase [Aurantiacibacter sp. 219JJ12-13]MDP5261807.1 CmcJ/NvfI family oxidoreductase [Aurantiacibacter sp. 219JJ12-13]
MATIATRDIEDGARQVRAMMRYVDEGDFVTRRFVSQGREVNTGSYSDYELVIRDGMPIRDHFTLDVHGFALIRSPSAVKDFRDRTLIERIYVNEVEADILRLTGADKCASRGWMWRTTADLSEHAGTKARGYTHEGGLQPPAGEAHVDVSTATAERLARQTYEQCFPDGPGYKRFLVTSHWRTFSPPPQDMPLALCDGRTSFEGEEKSNTLIVVDEFPEDEALTAPVEGEDSMLAATIFSYHPSHRWWYFAGMQADDVLVFKFHDSDHSVTWRCPHSAFRDGSAAHPHIRESIECRSVAFWE